MGIQWQPPGELRTSLKNIDSDFPSFSDRESSADESQIVVDRSHCRRSFTNGGGHALGRSGAKITYREQPGVAGLEGKGASAQSAPPAVELALEERSVG